MHRLIVRLIPILALAVVASGCSNNDSVVAPPPVDTSRIDTFTGTLNLNGATAYSFTVGGTGNITAQLSTLSPDSTKPIGLSLGTWNGSICQIVLDNPASVQGSVVVGTASAVGDFCVRVYDASGNVLQPQAYVIDVSHQ
jgi:hypothetical protein